MPGDGNQAQPRAQTIRKVCGDEAGQRTSWEVSPWIRVRVRPGEGNQVEDDPSILVTKSMVADLKSSNQRDEIAAARASLKENSSLLHSICSACLEHSDVASLTASKDSICNEIQNALNVISNASQGVGNKMGQPTSCTATLGSALDELENLIILDPLVVNEEKIRPSLEKRLEAIISGAALLADSSCTRDFHRERIIAECNAIRQALQDLLSEYINNVEDWACENWHNWESVEEQLNEARGHIKAAKDNQQIPSLMGTQGDIILDNEV
ncbi:PREDICTED: catenin alpha-3 [Phaethon lepturus]|uniref:catenin alpha-3 n=1 Tax=Phaethon lepturus TaxID=97097 RepID=UPI000530AC94|nr:PREDICTED: catenin alpha-3 [Phaethon lepturus]